MAPRGNSLPQAATESAREARKSFFCELCQKGYARMNDFEAHEGSYDHQHRKRMKELKQLTKDPNAAAKARAAEQKAKEEAGMKSVSISLAPTGSSSGKKKPVFKSTLQPHNAAALGQTGPKPSISLDDAQDAAGAIRNGWSEDRYSPRFITGCDDPRCHACRPGNGRIDLGKGSEDTIMKARHVNLVNAAIAERLLKPSIYYIIPEHISGTYNLNHLGKQSLSEREIKRL